MYKDRDESKSPISDGRKESSKLEQHTVDRGARRQSIHRDDTRRAALEATVLPGQRGVGLGDAVRRLGFPGVRSGGFPPEERTEAGAQPASF